MKRKLEKRVESKAEKESRAALDEEERNTASSLTLQIFLYIPEFYEKA